ncbi:MAG TPA: hypothetical protein VGJ21_01695 [Terracidiphilus sp.]|jgi:hypothetical protein
MTALDTRKAIQTLLQVAEDGVIGPRTLNALTLLSGLNESSPWPPGHLAAETDPGVHVVKATSFADPADVAAFRRCKAGGGSDAFCFGRGDNGVGKWGDDCTAGSGPACALPPEDWMAFGAAARNKKVLVKRAGNREQGTIATGAETAPLQVTCFLRDTMPHKANITNGAGIDLNPDACAALGVTPPVMTQVTWEWAH